MRVPRRLQILLAVVATVGASIAAVVAFTDVGRSTRARVGAAIRDPAAFVAPGPLSRHHAAVPELKDCESCHDLTAAPPDAKCLDCHEEIGRRRDAGEGWHATFEGSCAHCHGDHDGDTLVDFDPGAFNHLQARFPLQGAHQRLECASCHEQEATAGGTRMQWQRIEHGGCAVCHRDPHSPSLRADCEVCHDERGWTDRALSFVHARDTSFALSGAHADLTCEACHTVPDGAAGLASAVLSGTPTSCAECHDDPHAPSLGSACTDCHSDRGFTGRELLFVHNRDAQFHLVGAHAEVACEQCHVPAGSGGSLATARFEETPNTCATCHDDPHAGTLGPTCADCHGQEAWTGRALRFRHATDTDFPLTGAHSALECAQCHAPSQGSKDLASAAFRETPESCAGCHATPHGGQFDESCDACHATTGWTGQELRFDHDEFPLRGAHASVECAQCHVPREESGVDRSLATAQFAGLGRNCSTCHQDPHAGSLQPKDCTVCHTEDDFHRTTFDHAVDARFALDPTHARLSCGDCHESKRFRPLPTACADCHAREAAHLEGAILRTDVRFERDPHAGEVTCADCHDLERPGAGPVQMAQMCVRCHATAYGELHVARMARVDALVLRARRRTEDDVVQRARIDRLRRLAAHDYVPAEKALRGLAEGDGSR